VASLKGAVSLTGNSEVHLKPLSRHLSSHRACEHQVRAPGGAALVRSLLKGSLTCNVALVCQRSITCGARVPGTIGSTLGKAMVPVRCSHDDRVRMKEVETGQARDAPERARTPKKAPGRVSCLQGGWS